ncbi:PREDICTED: thyroid receptor-interacting protein 11-like [Priapulus caudatus]|uniref:Thyroid receptor-interacting protein 11-like n=1 Tax=Priapulus caudatus TaxID=37621 RepID=A0ABM1DT74_PRICU|nr:PREDICTED: thyroid receptor-interacting protein 11-like [Priapulus caudatus]
MTNAVESCEINDVKQKAHDSEERQSDQLSENGMLKETNNRLMMAMQEKDFELKALQEKVATLTELLQQTEGAGSTADNVQQLLAESERMQAQAQTFQHERDQVMLALKQRQVETGQLQSQVRSLSERERKLQAELERLREHLLQVEQSYTEEALQAEGREKDLRNRLAAAETKLTSSSSAAQNVSLQASLQIESLQEQLRVIAEQRDGTAAQLRASQTQAQQHAASLHNLELVLEQFQRDREAALGAEVDKWQQQLADREEDVITLKTQLSAMQNKVLSMEEALDAGQRLSEQVDRNAELITSLRQTVQEKEAEIEELHNHIIRFQTHEEGKVDKLIIKNLFLGYYTTPISKRTEVIRLIASVLNFTQDEIAKATGEGQGSSWLPGFLRRSSPGPQATPPNTPSRSTMARDDADKSSFSQMFIKFLEVESTPKATLRLPAEQMAQELHTKTHNPFISAMSTVPPAGSRAVRQRPPERHLLMKSLNDTLPTFQPVPVDGKMDSAIIKTVLQPQP